MEQLKEFLPFLIPLVIAQFSLLGYTILHRFSLQFSPPYGNRLSSSHAHHPSYRFRAFYRTKV